MRNNFKKYLLVLSTFFCCTGGLIANVDSNAGGQNEIKDSAKSYETFDLRNGIIESYYNKLNDKVKSYLTIDDFTNNYMNGDIDIETYVKNLNSDALEIGPRRKVVNGTDYLPYDDGDILSPLPFAGMRDADFIISDNHGNKQYSNEVRPLPAYTFADRSREHDKNTLANFYIDKNDDSHNPREPVDSYVGVEKFYKQFLQPGDIVIDEISFMNLDPINFVMHAGMVVNTEKQYVDREGEIHTFVETIEAYASGVRFGFIDPERILKNGTIVIRPNASDSVIDKAVDFMFKQIGKEYFIPVDPNQFSNELSDNIGLILNAISDFSEYKDVKNEDATRWYCTELVFSAYYNAGINPCCIAGSDAYPGKNGKYQFVIGNHFLDSISNTYVPYASLSNKFLNVWPIQENSSSWTFAVQNSKAEGVFVSYNPQFEHYGNLASNSVDTYATACVYLEPNEIRYIEIKKNLLLSSFIVYAVYGDNAYVTIGNSPEVKSTNISNNTKTYGLYSAFYLAGYTKFKKTKARETYKIGLKRDGNYKLLIKNSSQSTLAFRMPSSLQLVPESSLEKYNTPCYGNENLIGVYKNSYETFDIANNSNSYFALRTNTSGSVSTAACNVFKFTLDKATNSYTIKCDNVSCTEPRLQIVSKSGSTWVIRIRNFTNSDLSITYNSKMCFFKDAMNLTNLVDLKTITVKASGYKDVSISENLFANSIVAYATIYSKKCIGYAKELDKNTKLMNYFTSTI